MPNLRFAWVTEREPFHRTSQLATFFNVLEFRSLLQKDKVLVTESCISKPAMENTSPGIHSDNFHCFPPMTPPLASDNQHPWQWH